MHRKLTTALAAAALVVGSAFSATAQDGGWRSCHQPRRPGAQIPRRLQAVRLCQPGRTEGRGGRLSATGTFDSLNFVPPKGSIPAGLGLIYDTLMSHSMDEVSTEYGLLADAVKFPPDYSSVTYRLRDGAKWHDGEPITVDDVIFSFNALKEYNPQPGLLLSACRQGGEDRRARGDLHLRREGQPRTAPYRRPAPHPSQALLGGNRRQGQQARHLARHPRSRRSAPAPIGSSRSFPARTIAYERVPDYWGKDLPVNVGTNNFDEIRYEYFRDETVELEGFKADQIDWRDEPTARVWATGYDFPAVKDEARQARACSRSPTAPPG